MLSDVVELRRRASAVVREEYDRYAASDVLITRKGDDSPLTTADTRAHAVLHAGLVALTPDVPVISEEGAIPSHEERRDWRRFWLVDPLDGTKEFINRNGQFTVNVALIEDGMPVLGVVDVPVQRVTYYASVDEGAWRQREGEAPERIHSRPPTPGEALTVVTSRSHGGKDAEELLPGWTVGEEVPTGSSLKFCVVAEGRAHAYPRLGPTMEWDVAAGDCVFRCSGEGGLRASPITYNKPDLRNGSFVVGVEG